MAKRELPDAVLREAPLRMVEVRINCSDAMLLMQQMCLWLDARQITPSRFTSTEVAGSVVVRTEFQGDAEAEAFAAKFAGICHC
jgi:hypothetical protein